MDKSRRLYHFTTAEYGIQNIQRERLKIARVMELNDPFEMHSFDVKDRTLRRGLKKFKEDFSKKVGFLSFSRSLSSPVQWAHYSDKHKGICLGFDVALDRAAAIRYIDQRIDLGELIKVNGFSERLVMAVLYGSKYHHWSYEEEFRMLASLSNGVEENGLYFLPFGGNLVLREVVVGCQSKIKLNEIEKALGVQKGVVDIYKVRPAFGTYSMVRNRSPSALL
ncbi:hypothetical protein AB7M22_002938 [Pseudomonas sp. ADAK2 TE3594]